MLDRMRKCCFVANEIAKGREEKVFSENKIAVGLAPMAGFTDLAFRKICAENGADFAVTEMVSAKGLYYNNEKTEGLLNLTGNIPEGAQLFGSETEPLTVAADFVAKNFAPAFIDFNMGCPVNKIVNSGDGASLLKNLNKALSCVKAVINGAGKTPVTVKFRLGFDSVLNELPDFAKELEALGVSALFVHGRTAKQMYMPPVDYAPIAKIAKNVSIPVFANGDINSAEKAVEVLKITGAKGLLIGRAALGNPFIFSEIKAAINGKSVEFSAEKTVKTALKQLDYAVCDKGERRAVREARSQLAFYLKGLPHAAEKRRLLSEANTKEDVIKIFTEQ